MRDGDEKLEVTLRWLGNNGVSVDKIYTFYRGRYDIDLTYRVNNAGDAAWQGRLYRQLKRSNFKAGGQAFTSTYTGAIVSNTEKAYQKIDFDDMDDGNLAMDMKGGWVAMIQHYFIGAFIADENEQDHAYTKVSNDKQYVIGLVAQPVQVAAGTQNDIKTRLFIGPKLQEEMAAVAKNLDLVVDYGWLTILSQPIYWVMTKIHSVVGNWGWSIILLTLSIKLLFFKLSETSYRSMARMRKVTPRMKALKERFGDDKAGFQQAMMKMYQEEKINPLGGCLPILIQIPVFIALYWVLLEAVELRQAPFIFWLKDLSTADPYFILPVIMGATMLLQHRLNPTPLDPTQAKIMMMLPIMFTFFFMFFPSGLVLYWVVNNILSISQQWVITRRVTEGKE
jgi:YidC/Oxa1 family membrane protein insertase